MPGSRPFGDLDINESGTVLFYVLQRSCITRSDGLRPSSADYELCNILCCFRRYTFDTLTAIEKFPQRNDACRISGFKQAQCPHFEAAYATDSGMTYLGPVNGHRTRQNKLPRFIPIVHSYADCIPDPRHILPLTDQSGVLPSKRRVGSNLAVSRYSSLRSGSERSIILFEIVFAEVVFPTPLGPSIMTDPKILRSCFNSRSINRGI